MYVGVQRPSRRMPKFLLGNSFRPAAQVVENWVSPPISPSGGVEAAVLRRPQAAQDVGPGRGVGVAEVVGEVPVVVVDGLGKAPVDDARGLEVRRLRVEQEPELDVGREIEPEAGAPGERVLGADLNRRLVDRAHVDTVAERPARGAADLHPGVLRPRRRARQHSPPPPSKSVCESLGRLLCHCLGRAPTVPAASRSETAQCVQVVRNRMPNPTTEAAKLSIGRMDD